MVFNLYRSIVETLRQRAFPERQLRRLKRLWRMLHAFILRLEAQQQNGLYSLENLISHRELESMRFLNGWYRYFFNRYMRRDMIVR